jgi:hypothetical protein
MVSTIVSGYNWYIALLAFTFDCVWLANMSVK